MAHFARFANRITRYAVASVAYMHLHPGNYEAEYSADIDEQLKILDAKCPQGDQGLVMERQQLFKSRYDAYGDDQSVFLATSDELIVGCGSAMITQYVIDKHDTKEYTEAYLLDLRVDPDHRRKGIGSSITQLSFDWAKSTQNASIATFGIAAGNEASANLYKKRLKEHNTKYFVHSFTCYAMKEIEVKQENKYNVSIETICDKDEQDTFLIDNIPEHYVLYPNKSSLHNLIHSGPFHSIYVARLIDEDGAYVNNEWLSVSVYDQSEILHYLLDEQIMAPLSLTAKMSTVKDKDNETYILQELISRIKEDYDGKMCTMYASKVEEDEVYGHFFEPLARGNEYFVNLEENNELYANLEQVISNTGSKELWIDPRKC